VWERESTVVKSVLSHHLYDEAVTVVWERETTMVKSVLSHHLYDEAVTVEGVGEGDYCDQVCFKSPPL
jgi:hypothetical protein